MFKYIYFSGTGCGRPLTKRQQPLYLIGFEGNRSIMFECGRFINSDNITFPEKITQIEMIFITAPDIELYAGLPSLIHSMQLLNRSKLLKIFAPKIVNKIILEIINADSLELDFEVSFVDLEEHDSSKFSDTVTIHTPKLPSSVSKFQVFVQNISDEKEVTIFYTGKSAQISDANLLSGDKYVIHDCTYSYDDWALNKKTGLASYKDVLEFNKKYSPNLVFLVHYSSRYQNPLEEIAKHRIRPQNILTTYDGFRFNFVQC